MFKRPEISLHELRQAALALSFGAAGAALGWAVSLPLYLLTGPAIIISLLALVGFDLKIPTLIRDFAFLFIGIGIGSGVNAEAADAMLRWPLAFIALFVMLVVAMAACREVLSRGFGFTRRSAVLASAPGHLSFVLALAASSGSDVMRVTVAQSVRLLLLTLVVPAVAVVMGLDLSGPVFTAPERLSYLHLVVLVVVSLIVAAILKPLRVPAPILLGALLTSALAHLTDVAPGVLEPRVTAACLIVMGTLIGSRFVGVTPRQLAQVAGAGLTTTVVTVLLACLAAIPAAYLIDMPVPHVLVAFAPGGLETMIVMGAVLGANPGFVAAAHVGRLLMLSVLIPIFVARSEG